ncbi:hypothetical protein AVDCRST_MAG94-33 [uncultured Leptolyngbya sp.]|uniref:Uncharacterized protein n=1 Tax=uncultured Leptolyngbya sp. TaxID=332963 RepID=A0A6J4K543_9CYAN|nr:hypothetical protein AVDCRST_MAG94-33 [uncultured Leptolyngbya sp.]
MRFRSNPTPETVVDRAEAPVTSLKTRFESAYRRVKKSKVWDCPKQQQMLDKLLATLEQLVEQE